MENAALVGLVCDYYQCDMCIADALIECAKKTGTLESLVIKVEPKEDRSDT